jgi:putative ABC transport system permease protein
MITNYLKVAIRNLIKHKGYAFINILGLAVGIAASVKADRTYRIKADWSNNGDSRIHQLGTPFILAQTIREKYPQVEAITQLSGPLGDVIIRYQDTTFKETDAFCAEPSFFDVFSFPLLKWAKPSRCRPLVKRNFSRSRV